MKLKSRNLRHAGIDLTENNRQWLNIRFSNHDGVYYAHQPIWGYNKGSTEGGHALRFARTLNLLRLLFSIKDKASLLDVGAAEGYTAALVRRLIPSCQITTADLSHSLAKKANELFGLRACTANAAELPFTDGSFDVVLCSEVIEHTANPFHALYELMRVARKFVILTTEAHLPWGLYRKIALKTRETGSIHYDRNIWTAKDFFNLFPDSCVVYPQFSYKYRISDLKDTRQAKKAVLEMAESSRVSINTAGLIVVVSKDNSAFPDHNYSMDAKILDLLFSGPIDNKSIDPVDLWSEQWLNKALCPKCRKNSLKISRSGEVICELCFSLYGRPEKILDFLPRAIKDYDQDSERQVILKIGAKHARQRYLFSLVDEFSEDNAETNPFFYYFYRALRRVFRVIHDIFCLPLQWNAI